MDSPFSKGEYYASFPRTEFANSIRNVPPPAERLKRIIYTCLFDFLYTSTGSSKKAHTIERKKQNVNSPGSHLNAQK
jgi:hypothetical protein